jgi:hypothetical protein
MESASILTMTLAWDNFSLSNFGKALHLLEVSLNQVLAMLSLYILVCVWLISYIPVLRVIGR